MTRGGRAGVTLMELAVTITVTGVIAVAGYGAFASLIDQRAVLREATVETERAAALRETLGDWLAGGQVLVPNDGPAGTLGTSDELQLTTTALTPAAASRTFIRLFTDGDPATPERGLTMEYVSWSDTLTTRELEPMVAGLRVEFLDRRTHRWYPAREAATIQPIAVRVTLEETPEAPLPPLLRLPFISPVGLDPAEHLR